MQRKYIQHREEALECWQKFNAKHFESSKANHDITEKLSDNFDNFAKKLESPFRKYMFERSVKTIQSIWRDKTTQDTLVPASKKKLYTATFNEFMNYDEEFPLKKSINLTKRQKLLKKIKKGTLLGSKIFRDPYLPQLALGLRAADKITAQQLSTVLEMHQGVSKNKNYQKQFLIIDDKGKFTQEAEKYFIPIIQNRINLRRLNQAELNEFRLLLLTLPISERVFYYSPPFDQSVSDLGYELIELDGLLRTDSGFLHLACGARDAYGIALFGLEEYVPPVGSLHAFGPKKLELGEEESQIRYATIDYPGVRPVQDIHYMKSDPVLTFAHDIYHSYVVSSLPDCFFNALQHSKTLFREITGLVMSKEIWNLIDGEFTYFFINHQKNIKIDYSNLTEMTKLFCDCVDRKMFKAPKRIPAIFCFIDKTPNEMGLITILDMLKNPDKWKNDYKVDPAQLSGFFGKYYGMIKSIYNKISDDPPKIQLLKCQLYLTLKEKNQLRLFDTLSNFINSHPEEFKKRVSFRKLTDKLQDNDPLKQFSRKNGILRGVKSDRFLNSTFLCLDQCPVRDVNTYLLKAILKLNYTEEEALEYARYRAQGVVDASAQYHTKPNFINWFKANLAVGILAAVSVVGFIPFVLHGLSAVEEFKIKKASGKTAKNTESSHAPMLPQTDTELLKKMQDKAEKNDKEFLKKDTQIMPESHQLLSRYRFNFNSGKTNQVEPQNKSGDPNNNPSKLKVK